MKKLKHFLKKTYEFALGSLTLFLLLVNITVFFIPVLAFGVVKLIPITKLQDGCSHLLHKMASHWIRVNTWFIEWSRPIEWQIENSASLTPDNWYLVVSNHQSWMDIPVLQKVFNHRIPMIKPFVKDELKWLPLLGFAWWAMDIPFVKRYSREQIQTKPKRQHKDKKSTQRSCERFKRIPVSVMSFIEGTRFTVDKKSKQESPYSHLLKPKAGGVSQVMGLMGEKLSSLLDVTILYPQKHNTLWDYFCGRVHKVKIFVREIEIPFEFRTQNFSDPKSRQAFYDWLNQMWHEKDLLIMKERFAC